MYGRDITDVIRRVVGKKLKNDDVVFLCIGTDRSTGDSLGPLVGTYLTEMGYNNVIGTVDYPVHAVNLQETVDAIVKDRKIIAIDACLGQFSSVGKITVARGPIKPGAGVDKDLPEVGDFHIAGVVNIGGFMEYFVLQNTRLSTVMKMAGEIASAIQDVFPLEQIQEESKGGKICQLIQLFS